jgi:hypothetical protein
MVRSEASHPQAQDDPAPPTYEEPVVPAPGKKRAVKKGSEDAVLLPAASRPREVEASKKAGKKGSEEDVSPVPSPSPQAKLSRTIVTKQKQAPGRLANLSETFR